MVLTEKFAEGLGRLGKMRRKSKAQIQVDESKNRGKRLGGSGFLRNFVGKSNHFNHLKTS
ncbi:MAG: hypothetical protein HUK02_07620 [Bacteroidaceae bacterium]|nr:hypothetical protein [Bacteroidaceae bacterium]